MAKETYKTWLPVFPGFYETGFLDEDDIGYATDMELESLADEYELPPGLVKYLARDCFLQELCPDISTFEYEDQLAKECCNWVEETLREIFNDKTIKVEFEKVVRPREYNFKNDAVDVKIAIDLEQVFDYIQHHMEAFATYLKENYTSCDGFISHYSPEVENWLDYGNWNQHQVGAVLDFVIRNCVREHYVRGGYADEQMLYYVLDHVSPACYMNTPQTLEWILKSTFMHDLAEDYEAECRHTREYLENKYHTDVLNYHQQHEYDELREKWLEWVFSGFETEDDLLSEACESGESYQDYLRRIA